MTPGLVRIFGEDLGEEDEGTAVVGPGLDLRQLIDGGLPPGGRGGPGAPRQRTEGGERRGEVGEGSAQGLGGIGPEADHALHRLQGLAEHELGALGRAEQVADRGERAALHALEQQGGPAGLEHAAVHLGDLQVRVELVGDPNEVAVAF